VLSLDGIIEANRLSRLTPSAGRLSVEGACVVGVPGNAKLPKFPIGDIAALVGLAPQVDEDPLPRIPPVLVRMSPPKGKPFFVPWSSPESFRSVGRRRNDEDSSRPEKRPVPAGDPKPVIESEVCCRRFGGLLEAGEERFKLFEFWPCEIEVLRPFAFP
jgi:hypothetical protein